MQTKLKSGSRNSYSILNVESLDIIFYILNSLLFLNSLNEEHSDHWELFIECHRAAWWKDWWKCIFSPILIFLWLKIHHFPIFFSSWRKNLIGKLLLEISQNSFFHRQCATWGRRCPAVLRRNDYTVPTLSAFCQGGCLNSVEWEVCAVHLLYSGPSVFIK